MIIPSGLDSTTIYAVTGKRYLVTAHSDRYEITPDGHEENLQANVVQRILAGDLTVAEEAALTDMYAGVKPVIPATDRDAEGVPL
jgi:hypothetical protein|tara:strand:- start:71 stop:325 length:255 start_codon:yes stop_codon:yes gene_type:complete